MSWRDRLRRPSWRGIGFDVDTAETSGGRRLAVHEYPQQDEPYAEDLGRATRRVHLTGFVTGDLYFAERDLLLEALETPGPGTLVHPFWGEMKCNVETYSVREDVSTGRMAVFEIDFVEAGEHMFPLSALNPSSMVGLAVDGALAMSGADFLSSWDGDGPGWTLDSAVTAIESAVDTVRSVLDPISDFAAALGDINVALNRIENAAAALVATPEDLVSELQDCMGLIRDVGENALDVFDALSGDAGAAATVPAGSTPAHESDARNRTALDRLLRRQAMCEGARVSATLDFVDQDEATLLRDWLSDRLEAEADAAEGSEVPASLHDLSGLVIEDLTTKASSLARVRNWTPSAPAPASVLAHDLYGDASRGDELVERNRIVHPSFCWGSPLRVASS